MLTVLAISVLFAGAYTLNSHLEKGCKEIESIARDVSAVAYMNQWVSTYVLDKGYTFVGGMHGTISARSNGEYIEITPLLDESKSRIRVDYLRFNISTLDNDLDIPVTKKNAAQIDIGLGRNQVILLKNGATLTSYRGHDINSGHLRKINNITYAYCADARF